MSGTEVGAVLAVAVVGALVWLAWRGPRLRARLRTTRSLLAETERYARLGSLRWDVRRRRATWSPNLYAIHGVEPRSFTPTVEAAMALVHPDDRPRVADAIADALAGRAPLEMSYRIVRLDGEVRHLEWRGRQEGDGLLTGALQDVTERRRAERWLIASETRYRLIVENANDGIWVLDAEGRTDFVNRRVCEMLGRRPEELLGRSPIEFTDEEGAALLAGGAAAHDDSHVELSFRHADGQPLWVALSRSRFEAPWGTVHVNVLTDLTQRRELEERLRHSAERDRLTGLWNRSTFERLLGESLERHRDAPHALIVIGLDHFKFVNDSLGHQAGDGLLQRVGVLFARTMRIGDELARMGGDEFAVLLGGAGQEAAMRAAERLLDVLRSERWRGLPGLRASAGIALAGNEQQLSASDLLVAADLALHEAKENGGNRLAVYTGDRGGLTWVEEVRAAIEEERLALHSQPIVPLDGGRRTEELLVRMVGRDGQLVPPVAFIPPAERFGLIVAIDRWVVDRAVELAMAGRAVEINLSGQSLGDQRIRDAVDTAVAGGLNPALLTFEITETAAARNLDGARAFAQHLTGLGCAFAIDDFGTGFGSLLYLRHLPVSKVKIDVQFVRGLLTDPGDERVVSAVVSTARALGQQTVAEGVEDEATFERLKELGVDYAQGYFIARPQPVAHGEHASH